MLKPIVIKRIVGQRLPSSFLKKWVSETARALSREKLAATSRKKLRAAREISLVFVSRAEIRRLNRQFRSKDKATDVLSFAPSEDGSLGELVLCLEVIRRQATEHGLSLNEELGYMVLHGILHLLGYDHELSAAASRRMLSLQDRVFERLLRN